MSSRAIRLELGPGSGAHTWHLRLWSKATRSQCTEGLGGEKGAERVAKVRRLRREGALCPISDGGCTRVNRAAGRARLARPQAGYRSGCGCSTEKLVWIGVTGG